MAVTPPKPARRLERGSEVDLTVDSFAHGGNGVARHEGYVVFVQGAIPGDRVRARIGRAKRDYAEARTLEILEPSSTRVEQRTPHPGAPWQVLSYERQLAEKQSLVADALTRIGHFEQPPVATILAADEQWHYRNKLEYSFGGGPGDALVLGFHRPGRWNEIDDISTDVLASERVDRVRDQVKEWCAGEGLAPYDRRAQDGFLRNLVVREGRRTGMIQARIVTSMGEFRAHELAAVLDAESVLWTRVEDVGETTRSGTTELLKGPRKIDEELHVPGATLRFRLSPQAFFQTNTEMAERLYGIAAELAGLSGRERVFDLYSGIGAIALTLALSAGEVWGIEVVEEAISDAIETARGNGVDNAKFFAGDVRTALRPLVERAGVPDVVVVDPPRAGLSAKVVRRVLETEARRIVYVSCNPTTLAPNARQIVDAGYRLATVRPVDMFPQTPHIECVALLERE
ncbi:MAG: 23S rRNA (uracil(1939)-C(5))-methyltransferase RlmD [Thermoleophilaceae bacterium]